MVDEPGRKRRGCDLMSCPRPIRNIADNVHQSGGAKISLVKAANSPDKSGRSYLGIDIVRFCSAMMVFGFHLIYKSWQENPRLDFVSTAFAPIAGFFSNGWVGVEIFFVVSGFVIAFSAQDKSLRAFVRGRLSRLYPAAWICATVTLALTFQVSLLDDYLRSMLLLPVGPWISPVYWTLGVEIIFYLLVALVLGRIGPRGLPGLMVVIGGWSTAFWLLKVVNRLIGHPLDPWLEPLETGLGPLLLLHYGCQFALGMAFWQVTRSGLTLRTVLPVMVFGGVGFVAVTARSYAVATGPGLDHAFWAPLIWAIATAAIFASVLWSDGVSAALGRIRREVRLLGLLTYPLYLVHQELGFGLMLGFRGLGPWGALAAAVAATLAVAFVVVKAEEVIRGRLWPSARRPMPSEEPDPL